MNKTTTIVIKKYQNRKLYDTSNSKYVKLKDVLDMKRSGKDVMIVDNKTKVDITTKTLFDAFSNSLTTEQKHLIMNNFGV